MDMALRTLEASPVSTETVEVLEALGPPRERLARAETFAEMGAFGRGVRLGDGDVRLALRERHRRPSAAAAPGARVRGGGPRRREGRVRPDLRQLAGQEEEARRRAGRRRRRSAWRRPRSPAKAAGKPTGKTKGKSAAKRPAVDDGLIASAEAEGRHAKQRAARSVDWQRALLVVARDALPALVDNDDQPDLATLVATLKRHLDEAGRGPVDEELTTLYRAASAHLKSGPRAYAETVGSSRRPILLGDILIGRSYDVRAPAIDLTPALEEAGPLVFVPRSAPIRRRRLAALAGELPRRLDGRRLVSRWVLLVAIAVVLAAADARAQSLVDKAPEDPCEAARALDIDDTSPAAEHLRRSCRLAALRGPADRRAAPEGRGRGDSRARRASSSGSTSTQPSRVTHPISVEAFVGSGLAELRFRLRLGLRAAGRGERLVRLAADLLPGSVLGGKTSDCGRTAFGLKGRWYLTDYDLTPFVDDGPLHHDLAPPALHLVAAVERVELRQRLGNGQQPQRRGGAGIRLPRFPNEPRIRVRVRVLHGGQPGRRRRRPPAPI